MHFSNKWYNVADGELIFQEEDEEEEQKENVDKKLEVEMEI